MSKVRESARDEDCTLRFSVCNWSTATTVYCHTNDSRDGKGLGLKSKKGCYGCSSCHDVMDGRAPRPGGMSEDEMNARIEIAVEATDSRLLAKGLPVYDDHKKASSKLARRLAKGGHSKIVKRRLVGEWREEMKALIKAAK